MDRQLDITEAIKAKQGTRRKAAQFYLFKHLAGVSVYEQALLVFVWLHVGTKYKSWDLDDHVVMTFCKCGRTTFFEALRSCQTRSLLAADSVDSGRRRYRLCESNLVELMGRADQRRYFELLGHSPSEIEVLVPSAVRMANPRGGQAVRETDAHKETMQEGLCKKKSNSPPPPPQEGSRSQVPGVRVARSGDRPHHDGDQAQHGDAWEVAVAELCDCGVVDWETPIEAAKRRVDPDHVLALIAYWRRCGAMYPAAALRARVRRAHRSVSVERGWPKPVEASVRMRAAMDLVSRAVEYAQGEADGELDREHFAEWVTGQAAKQDYTAAETAEALERLGFGYSATADLCQ